MANSNGARSTPPSPTPSNGRPPQARLIDELPSGTVADCARDRANGETAERDQLRAAYGLPLGLPRYTRAQ